MLFKDVDIVIKGVLDEPLMLIDEKHPYYFSDSCRSIRGLLEENHRTPSEMDTLFSTLRMIEYVQHWTKRAAVEILKKYNSEYFQKVTESDLDGRVFKTMNHGMDASLRGLFDRVYNMNDRGLVKKIQRRTLIQVMYMILIAAKNFRVSYSTDFQVEVDNLDR